MKYVKPDYRGEFPLGSVDWECFAMTELNEKVQKERERRKKEARVRGRSR